MMGPVKKICLLWRAKRTGAQVLRAVRRDREAYGKLAALAAKAARAGLSGREKGV